MSDDKRCPRCNTALVWMWRTFGITFGCYQVCVRCGYIEHPVKREAVRHGN